MINPAAMRSFFESRRVLVTGGTGYIGSHTVVQLLEAGVQVSIVDNLCNSKRAVINRIEKIAGRRPEFLLGDVRESALLKSIFANHKFDTVIHFAGLKSVGESVKNPLAYYDSNVAGSLTLFKEMERAGVKNLVFSSSATVYGDSASVPITETCPLNTNNPYGQSKLMVEEILRDLYKSDASWNIALLRYFNPVGAHESGLIGEDPSGIPNNLMPFIAQVAVGKREKLAVFGNDYPTPDGTGVRDYIHVDDLASGHLAAINALYKQGGLITVNLGTGRGYSVLEMIQAFQKASGKSIDFEITNRRPGDIAACYADPFKAKELLGWVARYDIDRMCVDAWRWQSLNPLGFID
jgi:UDP-glucose 4-epimerase